MAGPNRREALCGGCALALLAGCDSAPPAEETDTGAPPTVPTGDPPTGGLEICDVVVGEPSEGWVRFGYDEYPDLNRQGGSAYVQVGGVNMVLAQVEEGCFVAMERACSHEGVLIEYREPRNGFVCPRHGAIYAWDGRVLGGPAPRDLAVYAAGERDGALWVLIP